MSDRSVVEASAPGDATPMVRLVHVTTVPMSLMFLTGQVGFMKARGFEVSAISSPGPALDEFARSEEFAVAAVAMSRRITPWHDLVSVVGLWGRLRTIRPEMVHAHTPKGGLLGMIAAALARVPVRLYHIRGLPFQTATGFKRRLLRWSERVSCLLAHEVLCVSHSLREVAVAERICPAGKVNVLCAGSGNGVDARGRFNPARVGPRTRQAIRQRYQIPDDALVIGFVGRIVRDKGLVELAAAWECLRAERPDLHLLLVGPFEPQDPVPSEVETQLRRDDRVHLAGEVSDTPALYAAMDMVTLPTYREGFPNVPLEAAAMELPVVATRVAGCIDAVVDGITGTLVPPRDAAALAVALRKYASDPALRRRQGMAGRERALRDFAPELIWQALYQEYDRLLRARGLRQPAAGESPGTLQPSATGTDTWIS